MKPPKQPTVQDQIDRALHRQKAYMEIVLGYMVSEDLAEKILVELDKVTKKMKE